MVTFLFRMYYLVESLYLHLVLLSRDGFLELLILLCMDTSNRALAHFDATKRQGGDGGIDYEQAVYIPRCICNTGELSDPLEYNKLQVITIYLLRSS